MQASCRISWEGAFKLCLSGLAVCWSCPTMTFSEPSVQPPHLWTSSLQTFSVEGKIICYAQLRTPTLSLSPGPSQLEPLRRSRKLPGALGPGPTLRESLAESLPSTNDIQATCAAGLLRIAYTCSRTFLITDGSGWWYPRSYPGMARSTWLLRYPAMIPGTMAAGTNAVNASFPLTVGHATLSWPWVGCRAWCPNVRQLLSPVRLYKLPAATKP